MYKLASRQPPGGRVQPGRRRSWSLTMLTGASGSASRRTWRSPCPSASCCAASTPPPPAPARSTQAGSRWERASRRRTRATRRRWRRSMLPARGCTLTTRSSQRATCATRSSSATTRFAAAPPAPLASLPERLVTVFGRARRIVRAYGHPLLPSSPIPSLLIFLVLVCLVMCV